MAQAKTHLMAHFVGNKYECAEQRQEGEEDHHCGARVIVRQMPYV